MPQPELIINQLTTYAARQGEWPADAHREFLLGIGAAVKETLGVSISLGSPYNLPVDQPHRLPSDTPCGAEVVAFEHAIEVDEDPGTAVDVNLIAQARKICSACPVLQNCLENAESGPVLLPGTFGGKNMAERRPAWEKRLEERHALLGTLYQDVGQQVLKLVDKTDDCSLLATQLENMRKTYFPLAGEAPPQERLKVLSETVYQALADPKIIERARMLLASNGRTVLQHWIRAVEQGRNPLHANVELPEKPLTAAEWAVNTTLRQLHDGTLDYTAWARSQASHRAPRSALVFLALVGEGVPEGDEETLREIANKRLSVLDHYKSRKGRQKDIPTTKAILTDYYGLNGERLDRNELSARYGVTPHALGVRIHKGIALLRTLRQAQ